MLFAVRHVEYALKLVTGTSERVGYLLKDRIADVDEFVATLRQVAAGGTIVEPSPVDELLGAPAAGDPRRRSPRERNRRVHAVLTFLQADGSSEKTRVSSMGATAGDLDARAVYDETPYPLLIQTLALAVILAPTVARLS